jgi:hypothetical protein
LEDEETHDGDYSAAGATAGALAAAGRKNAATVTTATTIANSG